MSVSTSEFVLEAVEFDADGIGAVEKSDDFVDVGAGAGDGCWCGGVGIEGLGLARRIRLEGSGGC